MKRIFSILFALVLVLSFSLVAVPVGVVGGSTATIDVSQPVQVTSNAYYERGQSIVYDGTDYWLFWGRSTTFTGNYDSGNPDDSNYALLYKKASSIAGLASATAIWITDAGTSIYQGQTSAVYFDGKVWVFAAQQSTSYDIKAWTTTDGSSWTEVNPEINVGTPHQWAAVWDSKLVLAYCDGSFIGIKYTADGSTWTQGVNVVSKEGMPRLFVDDEALYCSHTTWGNPGEYWIYELSGNLDTGDWSTIYNIHGGTGWYPCDPYLEKVGSDYLFFSADMLSDYSKQYIQVFKSSTVAGFDEMSGPKMVTNGGSASDASCDMWPVVVNASGSSYLFYTSERGTSPETVSGTGNIWYYEIDWNTDNDHFDYIQPAIDAATGTTINVAAGTYDEQVVIDKSLTLRGAGEDQTFVKSSGSSPVVTVSADDVTIQDLEITDDTELPEGIRIVSGASTGLTVDHVDFTELGAGTGANAYGIRIMNSFANLAVANCDFVAVEHTTQYRTIGIFAPNDLQLSSSEVSDCTFQKIWTGIYLRSAIDGLDVTGNVFGPVQSSDFAACVSGIYIGDGSDYNFDIQNVLVADNTFTEYGRGVYVWNYANNGAVSNFEISGNNFTNSVWSSGIRFIAGLGDDEGVSFDGISVHDNTFTQDSDVGAHVALIDFRTYCELAVSDIAVTDNEITLSGGPYTDPWTGIAFLAYEGPFTNTVIDGNVLNGGNCGGAGTPPSTGVLLKHQSSTYWPSGILETDITHNEITGFDHGVAVYDNVAAQYGGLPTGSDVNINYNNIYGNTLYGVINGNSEVVDALYNWWGDVTGPSHDLNLGGQGDTVSDNVDFSPWLYEPQENFVSGAPCYAGSVVLDNEATEVVLGSYAGGWNSFSTPVTLDGSANTVSELLALTAGSGLFIERAQRFNLTSQEWDVVIMGNVVTENYQITPGEGLFIQVSSKGSIPILIKTTPTSPPMRYLVAGWNLIGMSSLGAETVSTALSGVSYSVVLSPKPPNDVAWSVPPEGAAAKDLLLGEAYWVAMGEPGILFGFTTTPVADNMLWELNQ